jgi:DNA-binding transcriptional ArsR family regulator
MNPETILAGTASLFLALGDKTRLRLLNLIRDREICVSSFTGALGHSQPLISRHLAYLRNSGLVEARRDGKWMHYSLSKSLDANTSRLLNELFRWMESHEGLRVDREKYMESQPATEHPRSKRSSRVRSVARAERIAPQVAPAAQHDTPEIIDEPVYEVRYEAPAHHNELEDFLL